MFNYKNTLLDVIELYNMKSKYAEKKVSLKRALEHYIKCNEYFRFNKF